MAIVARPRRGDRAGDRRPTRSSTTSRSRSSGSRPGAVGDPFWRWEGFSPSGDRDALRAGPRARRRLGRGRAARRVRRAVRARGLRPRARARPTRSRRVRSAAFLFVLQGIVTWEATSAFVELGLAFFTDARGLARAALGARAVPARRRSGRAPSPAPRPGTKYLGLVAAAIVRRRRSLSWRCAAPPRRRARRSPAARPSLAGGAWYLQNAIETGNPFYPLVFGGKLADAVRRRRRSDDDLRPATASPSGSGACCCLPVDLLVHGDAFDRGPVRRARRSSCSRCSRSSPSARAATFAAARRRRSSIAVAVGAPVAAGALPAARRSRSSRPWPAPRRRRGSPRAGARRAAGRRAPRRLGARLARRVGGAHAPAPPGRRSGPRRGPPSLERLTGTYDAFRAARARAGPGTVGARRLRLVSVQLPGPGGHARRARVRARRSTRREFMARARSLGIVAVLVGGDAAYAAARSDARLPERARPLSRPARDVALARAQRTV